MSDTTRAGVCTECRRLREQARAAHITNDQSRLTDVRVQQNRHREADHGQAVAAAAES